MAAAAVAAAPLFRRGRVTPRSTAFFLCDVQDRFRDLIQYFPSVVHGSPTFNGTLTCQVESVGGDLISFVIFAFVWFSCSVRCDFCSGKAVGVGIPNHGHSRHHYRTVCPPGMPLFISR